MSKNTLTTIIPNNPEELAYQEMYGRALNFLAGWLPHLPQATDTWRGIGTFTIQPPPSDADGDARQLDRLHWVADVVNQVIAVGGRITSIGWWANADRRNAPTISLRLGIGTIVTAFRSPDLFDLNLEWNIRIVDLAHAAYDNDDPLALTLVDHIEAAQERLSYNWNDIVAEALDFVPNNADA